MHLGSAAHLLPLLLVACGNGVGPRIDTTSADDSTEASASASSSDESTDDDEGADASSGAADTSDASDASSGSAEGSTAALESTTDFSTSSSSESGEPGTSSTTDPEPCGNGAVEAPEQCDDGQETKLCDDDCTLPACGDANVNHSAGEQCDDGNVDNTDGCLESCYAATCTDGYLQVGVEACDDGNDNDADGCTNACALATCGDGIVHVGAEQCDDGNDVDGDGCEGCKLPWAHAGVAHDVPVADLVGWEPCWAGTYEAGVLVSNLLDACTGDHILLACRPLGSDTLTLAAHAPRDDVFFEPQVDYGANERHNANAVGWYYSPYYGVVGFAPIGNKAKCTYDGQNEQMCWGVGGNQPLAFVVGYRCGPEEIAGNEGQVWERLAFQAND